MKILIEIHAYPSNGNDDARAHSTLSFDLFSEDYIDTAVIATKRELRRLLDADELADLL